MRCPFCGEKEDRVIDSRVSREGHQIDGCGAQHVLAQVIGNRCYCHDVVSLDIQGIGIGSGFRQHTDDTMVTQIRGHLHGRPAMAIPLIRVGSPGDESLDLPHVSVRRRPQEPRVTIDFAT